MSTQECLKAFLRNNDLGNPPFSNINVHGLTASPAVQAIIPTYKFYCDCVNITSWETYVFRNGGNKQKGYEITFQVWRPSPTVTNDTGYRGSYSLVGQNTFTMVSFTPHNTLIQLSPTPPSNSIITAQSGDVVGYYYINSGKNGKKRGIKLETDIHYDRNIVWYRVDTSISLNTNSLISVGSRGTLISSTNAAPMLKISSSKLE